MASLAFPVGMAFAHISSRAHIALKKNALSRGDVQDEASADSPTVAALDSRDGKTFWKDVKRKAKATMKDVTGKKKRRELAAKVLVGDRKVASLKIEMESLQMQRKGLIEENETRLASSLKAGRFNGKVRDLQRRISHTIRHVGAKSIRCREHEIARLNSNLKDSTVHLAIAREEVAEKRRLVVGLSISLEQTSASSKSDKAILVATLARQCTETENLQIEKKQLEDNSSSYVQQIEAIESELETTLRDKEDENKASGLLLTKLTDEKRAMQEELECPKKNYFTLHAQHADLQQETLELEGEVSDLQAGHDEAVGLLNRRLEAAKAVVKEKKLESDKQQEKHEEEAREMNEEILELQDLLKEKEEQLPIALKGERKIAALPKRRKAGTRLTSSKNGVIVVNDRSSELLTRLELAETACKELETKLKASEAALADKEEFMQIEAAQHEAVDECHEEDLKALSANVWKMQNLIESTDCGDLASIEDQILDILAAMKRTLADVDDNTSSNRSTTSSTTCSSKITTPACGSDTSLESDPDMQAEVKDAKVWAEHYNEQIQTRELEVIEVEEKLHKRKQDLLSIELDIEDSEKNAPETYHHISALTSEISSLKERLQLETQHRVSLILSFIQASSNPSESRSRICNKFFFQSMQDRAALREEVARIQAWLGVERPTFPPLRARKSRSAEELRDFKGKVSPLRRVVSTEDLASEGRAELASTNEDEDFELREIDQASGSENEEDDDEGDDLYDDEAEIKMHIDGPRPKTCGMDGEQGEEEKEEDDELLRLEESFY